MFGGRARGRAGVDWCPRPRSRADPPHLARGPCRTAMLAGRMCSALSSAPPEPREPRELNDSTSGRPTRLGLEISSAAPPAPARWPRALARPPGPCPSDRPAFSEPSSPLWAPPPPFPRDKPEDRYAAWLTAQGSGERAAGPVAAAATSALPHALPLRRCPATPPRSGLHTHTPYARAHGLNRVAQPTCSLFSAAITTCPGCRAALRPSSGRPPLASALGRRGRR